MNSFQKSAAKDEACPKCNKHVHHMYGGGWDEDREWCSNIKCDYEVVYETTTCGDED